MSALARLKPNCSLYGAGLVGHDAEGDYILEDCQKNKLDTKFLTRSNLASTSYTDVMSTKDGKSRTFFHQRGTNDIWDGNDIDFQNCNVKIFHLGYILLLKALDSSDEEFGSKAAKLLARA